MDEGSMVIAMMPMTPGDIAVEGSSLANISTKCHNGARVAEAGAASLKRGVIEEKNLQNVKNGTRQRFRPDKKASGAHSVFRREPITGKVSHYETYRPQTNPKDPKPWESILRYDGIGKQHLNKILDRCIKTPHVHDLYTREESDQLMNGKYQEVEMENVLEWLQQWYKSQCDGDWEHEYGVKIDTLDNPGWYVIINLTGTECEGHIFSPIRMEISDTKWYFCSIKNNNYEASCDPSNLTEVLERFRNWVENCKKQNDQKSL
jgi:hypothetical protein